MEFTQIFPRSLGENVLMPSGEVGRVVTITLSEDGRILYHIKAASPAASDGFLNASEISDLPPTVPETTISRIAYFNLFTAEEQLAISNSDNPQIKLALVALSLLDSVDLTDSTILGGLDGMTALGFLTPERAARIKTGQRPLPS